MGVKERRERGGSKGETGERWERGKRHEEKRRDGVLKILPKAYIVC